MTLRAIGYWYSDRDPSLPRLQDLVDPTWETAAREAMIDYLERGVVVSVSLGTSLCRICGKGTGGCEQSDGVFIWPDGLVHYLREHAVRLPDEFAREVGERIAALEMTARDDTWWRGLTEPRRT